MRKISSVFAVLIGFFLLFSCGSGKMSENDLQELKAKAEKGNYEAARQLADYYGNITMPLPLSEYNALLEKPNKSKKEQAQLEEMNEIMDNYKKWSQMADELSDSTTKKDER